MSEVDARSELEIWAKKIKENIEQEDQHKINEIGLLKKEDGKISFEADLSSPIFAENYGLETVNIPLIEIEGDIITTDVGRPAYNYTPVHANSWRKWALLAAAIIIIGTLFVVSYQRNYLQAGIKSLSEFINTNNYLTKLRNGFNGYISGNVDADKLKREALRYSENFKKSKGTISSSVQPSSGRKVLRYYLIAGSFKTMNRAEKLKYELTSKGFSPEILVFNDSIFRVSMLSDTIRRKAVDEYIRLTSEENNYKLWFFSQLTSK